MKKNKVLPKNRIGRAIKKTMYWLAFFALILCSIVLIRLHWIEIFKVPSASMMPTLRVGDMLLVNKRAYLKGQPQRGDIIVFEHPKTKELFVKRVIAQSGDTVMVLGPKIVVNGSVLETTVSTVPMTQWGDKWKEQLIDEKILSNGRKYHTLSSVDMSIWPMSGYWNVPSHSLFVMGDWRDHSDDSRDWGVVPLHNVVGQVKCVYDQAQNDEPSLSFRTGCSLQ